MNTAIQKALAEKANGTAKPPFAWDDVDFLLAWAHDYEQRTGMRASKFRSIADRIAARLPAR